MSNMLYGVLGDSSEMYYGILDSIPVGGVVLSSCDDDDAITSTQTAVPFLGSGLGPTTGDRTISILQGAVDIPQTQQSGDDTSGTFDVVFTRVGTDLKYGAATLTAVVGALTATRAITVIAPSGKLFKDVSTPNVVADRRITTDGADLAAGDQVEISNVVGGTAADVNVNDDGTFDCDQSVVSFDARVWSVADKTWGSVGTQVLQDISNIGPTGAAPKPKSRWFGYLRSRL